MKQLLTQLAAMQPTLSAGSADGEEIFRANIAEGALLRGLRDYIDSLGNSELRRLWQSACRKALPPARHHEHVHRKHLVETFLQSLSDEESGALSTPKQVRDHVQLEVIKTLEQIKRNDALYPNPVP
jgi:hypothetical protein